MAKKTADRVRLYPSGDGYIPGVRTVERLVPADVADRLLAYSPSGFTTRRPDDQSEPSDNPLEDLADIESLPEFAPTPVGQSDETDVSSPGGVTLGDNDA